MKTLFRPILTPATAAVAAALSGCAPTSPAAPQVAPQVTPINATIKLGRVIERTYLTRVEVPDGGGYPGYGVGVGAAGVGGGGGHGGGAVGLGFSIDLTQLFNRRPPQQIDLFLYKVQAADGTVVNVNAPALAGLEPGACARVIYPDGAPQPLIAPSNEC